MIAHLSLLVSVQVLCGLAFDQPQPVVIEAKPHARGNAECVALSADGKLVAAGFGGPAKGHGPHPGGIVVWKAASGKEVLNHLQDGDIIKIGFSRDARFLAFTRIDTPGDGLVLSNVYLFDLKTGKQVKSWQGYSFAFSPTADILAIGQSYSVDSELDIFSLPDLKHLQGVHLNIHSKYKKAKVRAIAFSADGKTGAALCTYLGEDTWVGYENGLAVFDPGKDKGRWIREDDSLKQAQAIAISPDGSRIVTGHPNGEARIWTHDAKQEPIVVDLQTKLAVFPVVPNDGETLLLFTQPTQGRTWSYAAGDEEMAAVTPYALMRECDLATGKFRDATWKFENARYSTSYPRFKTAVGSPETNSPRWAVSQDGKVLLGGFNGCSMVDLARRRLIRQFESK